MKIERVQIDGPLLITPVRHGDARGFFSETFSAAALAEAGVAGPFVLDGHSRSAASGSVRGLHFQAPPKAQAKIVRVAAGRIFDVAVDIRAGSPGFGRHVGVELSAENWCQLYVPAGFAHGFCTLEPDTEVLYKFTEDYAPELEGGLAWDDPALGIAWPVPAGEAVLSERDRGFPALADLVSPFAYDEGVAR